MLRLKVEVLTYSDRAATLAGASALISRRVLCIYSRENAVGMTSFVRDSGGGCSRADRRRLKSDN